MGNFVTSLIRTWVPIIVGAVIAWLASRGIDIEPEQAEGLVAFLTALFSGVYYLVIRWLEQRFPQIGWLLGQAKQVKYAAPKEVK